MTRQARSAGAPPPEAFTRREWDIMRRHRTPEQVHRFLLSLPYNYEEFGKRILSLREVVRRGNVHCLEAALVAAVMLEQHGYPPLLMSFESVDLLDHVIFIFRRGGRWGSVARSRDAGLHSRRPMFRSLRDLAWSYFDPYVDFTGRLKAYQLADLRSLGSYDWRLSPKNLWKVERWLIDLPHRPMPSSDRRYRRLLRAYRGFRRRHPHAPVVYYPGQERWMPLDGKAGSVPPARTAARARDERDAGRAIRTSRRASPRPQPARGDRSVPGRDHPVSR